MNDTAKMILACLLGVAALYAINKRPWEDQRKTIDDGSQFKKLLQKKREMNASIYREKPVSQQLRASEKGYIWKDAILSKERTEIYDEESLDNLDDLPSEDANYQFELTGMMKVNDSLPSAVIQVTKKRKTSSSRYRSSYSRSKKAPTPQPTKSAAQKANNRQQRVYRKGDKVMCGEEDTKYVLFDVGFDEDKNAQAILKSANKTIKVVLNRLDTTSVSRQDKDVKTNLVPKEAKSKKDPKTNKKSNRQPPPPPATPASNNLKKNNMFKRDTRGGNRGSSRRIEKK